LDELSREIPMLQSTMKVKAKTLDDSNLAALNQFLATANLNSSEEPTHKGEGIKKWTPRQIADQLTLLEYALLKNMQYSEFIDQGKKKKKQVGGEKKMKEK